jgi:hypothetical protein
VPLRRVIVGGYASTAGYALEQVKVMKKAVSG